jgi:Fe/S biogenesis protein NfuA
MITVTDEAKEKLAEYVSEAGEECRGIRIRAAKVGKYTFRYQIHLVRDQDMEDQDTQVDLGDFSVVLDSQSTEWMEGATVDFKTMDYGSGFEIDNPAATPDWDDPVAQKVQQVIDEKVLPTVGSHGGWVELDRVEGDTAYVQLGGGCQGCASASFTLSQGIANVITSEVEEIEHVVDETDHGSGTQPYYQS